MSFREVFLIIKQLYFTALDGRGVPNKVLNECFQQFFFFLLKHQQDSQTTLEPCLSYKKQQHNMTSLCRRCSFGIII